MLCSICGVAFVNMARVQNKHYDDIPYEFFHAMISKTTEMECQIIDEMLVIEVTNSNTTSDENVVKMTYPLQWFYWPSAQQSHWSFHDEVMML